MTDLLRTLNVRGISEYESFLSRLAAARDFRRPSELLTDANLSEPFEPSIQIELNPGGRPFSNRYLFGRYLNEKLASVERSRVVRNFGLWNWLSLYYFDQLCPQLPNETRRVYAKELYFISPRQIYRQYFRHLVRAPWIIVREHGEHAQVLLVASERAEDAPLAGRGYIFEQLASRQNILNNKTMIAGAYGLYFDGRSGRPRWGAATKGEGSARRFALVIQQLELTFDTRSCSTEQFLQLLPKEFDLWKQRAGFGTLL